MGLVPLTKGAPKVGTRLSVKQEWALTTEHICYSLDLGLLPSTTVRNLHPLFISLSVYSILLQQSKLTDTEVKETTYFETGQKKERMEG